MNDSIFDYLVSFALTFTAGMLFGAWIHSKSDDDFSLRRDEQD